VPGLRLLRQVDLAVAILRHFDWHHSVRTVGQWGACGDPHRLARADPQPTRLAGRLFADYAA
jgi:hypothetical protein